MCSFIIIFSAAAAGGGGCNNVGGQSVTPISRDFFNQAKGESHR